MKGPWSTHCSFPLMTEVVSDWTVQVVHLNGRVEAVVFSPGMAALCAWGRSLVGDPCAKAAN